jgi:tetratricopeptide (TPR) repeat protein
VLPARADTPRPIDRATDTLGPDGVPISKQDIQGLDDMQRAIQRYDAAEKDYRGTVSHIEKQEIQKKQKELKERYEGQIKSAEGDEKTRREDAILLFEKFLAKYPNDKRWTPDVIFSLAELYFERTSDEALSNTDPGANAAPPDFGKTIALYTRLLNEFPDYRLIDGAYYLLGYCLDKMGKELEARQAFLALVCSNNFKPLATPAPVQPSKGHAQMAQYTDPYEKCVPVKKDSRFIPEAWTRIGEYHFDYNELELAISSYARVLKWKDSPYYDKALYKLAWSYYRVDKYPDAIKRFDELVVFSDTQKASSGKEG